ncbi:hypothetical protein LCL95_13425 [Bacillus timonensis]|nr:hypothetical protein [Bacillus timonensis]
MLPLPEKFDANEWMVISILVGSLLLFRLPKRFPTSMVLVIIFFTSFTSRAVDHILASPSLDFYDIMDSGKFELFGIFTYFLYAPFGYLFIYFYDKYQLYGLKTVGYILGGSLFALGFEWVASKAHIFTYHDWEIAYSLTVYLVIQSVTLLFFNYLKHNLYQQYFQSKNITGY